MLSIYAALPFGSLVVSDLKTAFGENRQMTELFGIADLNAWNNEWDIIWRNEVVNAKSNYELMKSTLMLESCIAKHSFINSSSTDSTLSKLMNALPTPHFAMRNATSSAVALRLFCLDLCLVYNKTQKRVVAAPGVSRDQRFAAPSSATIKPPVVPKASTRVHEDIHDFADDFVHDRPKRAAAASAVSKIHSQTTYLYNSRNNENDDEEEKGYSASARTRESRDRVNTEPIQRASTWICSSCSLENSARARTCEACDTKKPILSSGFVSNSDKKRSYDDDEESNNSDTVKKRNKIADDQELDDVDYPEFDFDRLLANVAEEMQTVYDADTSDNVYVDQLKMKKILLTILRNLYLNEKSILFWTPVTDDIAPNYRYTIEIIS